MMKVSQINAMLDKLPKRESEKPKRVTSSSCEFDKMFEEEVRKINETTKEANS